MEGMERGACASSAQEIQAILGAGFTRWFINPCSTR